MRILSLSGYVPEHICDTIRFTHYAGDRNITHYCGYASDFISQVIHDEHIDGAVFPKTCDSTRIISNYLSDSDKFLYQIGVPCSRGKIAEDFYAHSIKKYKEAVEQYYSVKISDIFERISLINSRNEMQLKLYNDLEDISYYEYITEVHRLLKEPLRDQVFCDFNSMKSFAGKRTFIIGSFLANTNIIKIVEENGFHIVGDNLPESGRIVHSMPVQTENANIYSAISRSILSRGLSPTQNEFERLIERDIQEIKDKKIEAIIFITQKYCEPYDFLFSSYAREITNIPILHITINDSEDNSKVGLLVEAFADSL